MHKRVLVLEKNELLSTTCHHCSACNVQPTFQLNYRKLNLLAGDDFFINTSKSENPCAEPVSRCSCEKLLSMQVSVRLWVNHCRSKRACPTIMSYLNENHWRARHNCECALTCISNASMRNWIFKKHIYLLCCLLFIDHSSLSSLFMPPPHPVPWFAHSLTHASGVRDWCFVTSQTVWDIKRKENRWIYIPGFICCVNIDALCLHLGNDSMTTGTIHVLCIYENQSL